MTLINYACTLWQVYFINLGYRSMFFFTFRPMYVCCAHLCKHHMYANTVMVYYTWLACFVGSMM